MLPSNKWVGLFADSMGNIYSNRRNYLGGYKKLIQHIDHNGYYYISTRYNGEHKNIKVHKIVADCFLGDSLDLVVNHKDGNKKNNNITNLEYVTIKENIQHAYKIGLAKGRVGSIQSIINWKNNGGEYIYKKGLDSKISKIICCYRDGKKEFEGNGDMCAKFYGCSSGLISMVLGGRLMKRGKLYGVKLEQKAILDIKL